MFNFLLNLIPFYKKHKDQIAELNTKLTNSEKTITTLDEKIEELSTELINLKIEETVIPGELGEELIDYVNLESYEKIQKLKKTLPNFLLKKKRTLSLHQKH